jgi:hypothetical protein
MSQHAVEAHLRPVAVIEASILRRGRHRPPNIIPHPLFFQVFDPYQELAKKRFRVNLY